MNGDNGPGSPYRTLVALSAQEWKKNGSYIARQAQSLGLDSTRVEATLVRILEAWRNHTSTNLLQPWDWWYANGASSRRLSSRVNKDELRVVNDRFYADLGADPKLLDVHYDPSYRRAIERNFPRYRHAKVLHVDDTTQAGFARLAQQLLQRTAATASAA
jgi:hypothetical protein